MGQFTNFGDGSDGVLSITANTTEAPIDSSCSGTSGATSLSATNASFDDNQLILIHQTRGTGAGVWEINQIASYSTGTITTAFPLSNTYTDSGASQAQVRVLPQYSQVTIDSGDTYTAKAWDGNVGGILAFLCSGKTTVTGTISATGKGFRGGSANSDTTGNQGEGTSGAGSASTSANGSGGGGGGSQGSGNPAGGGGGGHGASGTTASNSTGGAPATGGAGGSTSGVEALTTLTFGGGGGAGGSVDTGAGGAGGAGGGIVLIFSKDLEITGSIVANGSNGSNGSGASPDQGGGGGGAGGAVFVKGRGLTLGTTKITATAGSAGTGPGGGTDGGAGGTGRVRAEGCSVTGSTNPTLSEVEGGFGFCGGGGFFLY